MPLLTGLQIENLLRAELPGAHLDFRSGTSGTKATLVVAAVKGHRTAQAELRSGSQTHVLELATALKAALA